MSTPTPTPRTDEQINGKPCTRFAIYAGDSLRDAYVPSEFARTLERELAVLETRHATFATYTQGEVERHMIKLQRDAAGRVATLTSIPYPPRGLTPAELTELT